MTGEQIRYEDVEVGQELPELDKGPMTTAHIMRWSSAIENFHRIHYDQGYAVGHDKLPDVLVNGTWKQHVLAQLLKDWAGEGGWPWKISFRYRSMDLPGDLITATGKVVGKTEKDGLGYIDLEIGLSNSRGENSTVGKAVVVLPLRNGRPVPYPFVPPDEQRREGTLRRRMTDNPTVSQV